MMPLAGAVAQAGAHAAAFALNAYLVKQKGKQILDPVATMCMLSFRTSEAFKGALVGVTDNFFQWSQVSMFQPLSRFWQSLSHEDFGRIHKAIHQIPKYWDARAQPELVSIAKLAILGLKKTPESYSGRTGFDNVKSLCKSYATVLQRWVESADSTSPALATDVEAKGAAGRTTRIGALFAKIKALCIKILQSLLDFVAGVPRVAPTKAQEAPKKIDKATPAKPFIEMIQTLWKKETLQLFVTFHLQGHIQQAVNHLASQKNLYDLELKKAEI